MWELREIKSYADIRRLVSPEVFAATMTYLSWHNRLVMTDIMTVPQAIWVALAVQQRPIDEMLYRGVKNFWDEHKGDTIESIEDCQKLADELLRYLFPK